MKRLILAGLLTLSALALTAKQSNYIGTLFFEDPPCAPPFCDPDLPPGQGGGGPPSVR